MRTIKDSKGVLNEIKSIIGEKNSLARDTFNSLSNEEKLTYIGYQLYNKGYYEGLEAGLEVGIIDDMKRSIRDREEEPP